MKKNKTSYKESDTGGQKIINEKTYQIDMLELTLLKRAIDPFIKDKVKKVS